MRRWQMLLKTAGLCAGFLVLTGAQHNGCGGEEPSPCDVLAEVDCPNGTLEDGGLDENGCPLPQVCVEPENPCTAAGGVVATYCTEGERCEAEGCGCVDYCECPDPSTYFDGSSCVPFPDPCTDSGGQYVEYCTFEGEGPCETYCECPEGTVNDWSGGCSEPPPEEDLCLQTGGYMSEWCDDGCVYAEGRDDGDDMGEPPTCGSEQCYDYCDCGFGTFDPFVGCVDTGELCEATGGHFCDGECECDDGMIYDPYSGCIPDPYLLCSWTGGEWTVSCDEGDGLGDTCWEDCACQEGYVFDATYYGCTPGPELLCDWTGGSWDETCSSDWGEELCWDDCTCPEDTYFDWVNGCTPDYASICVNGGGEWTVVCDDWGCYEDCACAENTYFDWVSGCVAYENCDNGLDDDADGQVDSEDLDCSWGEPCEEPGIEDCSDGLDNDCDGLYDCEDSDCDRSQSCGIE